jgi:RNA polymerase II-associated factor 1
MVQAIEASFAAAKLPPVHAQRPKDVKPVEVLSVYPDFERWPASHIRFVYEENPGMDVASVDGKSREEKIAALERALVKPYSVDAHDGSGEKQKFVALMLPADPAAADPAAADPATAAETEYEWIREYEYKLTQERESGLGTCAFYFYEKDKTARYVELDAKMSLTRRSKTAKRAEGAEWRPSKVTLKRVAPDDAEAERRVKARAAVEHPVPEDGGGGME